jgi:hypothetical protein
MSSRFSFWTYLIYIITICNLLLIVNLYVSRKDALGEYYNQKFLFVFLILLGLTLLFIFGIIKNRVLKITVDNVTIEAKNIFQCKKYKFDEIKGFITKTEITKVGLKFEIITIIAKNNVDIIIAESMYRNYLELKKNIEKHIINLDKI